MLLDIMYDNLTAMEKSIYANDHQMAQDTLASFYDRERNTDASYTMLIGKSKTMKTYLDAMYRNPKNQAIVDAFRKSIEIYNYNRQRQWSKNYYTRMDYMKEQLKAEMDRTGFDFEKDKLLMKMGRLHLSKGISAYGYNEIGNTLTEVANYHGKSALGIGFDMRYTIQNDTIVDALDTDNQWVLNYSGFTQFGDQTKWVLLDLKGMRQDFYWYPAPLGNKLNTYLEKLLENYDVLIIPPAYPEPTPNY